MHQLVEGVVILRMRALDLLPLLLFPPHGLLLGGGQDPRIRGGSGEESLEKDLNSEEEGGGASEEKEKEKEKEKEVYEQDV